MTIYDYVIFHKNCIDGYSSFIVLTSTKYVSSDAIIFPDVPSAKNAPPKIDGRNIIIMDVAYKYDVLNEIIKRSNTVTFIDHHITIHNDVLRLKNDHNKKINIFYDENESGASLTWKFFNKKKKLPDFLKYVKDNDIGKWKYSNTHAFIAALEVNYELTPDEMTINKWKKLFKIEIVKKLIGRGKIYEEYIEYLLKINSKKYSMELFPSEKIYETYNFGFSKPAQYKVAVICGSGCPSTSLLGLKLMNTLDCDFALIWLLHMDKKEYVISLRSKTLDVGKIAQIFGGGGHKLASAFSISIKLFNIQEMFMPHSLPRQ